ncbi:MAG: response regulator [Phenylobacterium sp.]|uniref:response regulator n=1 Tax=Phenylobacterium sp. TaxID=1871053 RepID=UPI0025D97EC3|nr:response regulator [Phenylobacterium sp.]MCG9916702.1 response regulator [Phenylobacterium sp.]
MPPESIPESSPAMSAARAVQALPTPNAAPRQTTSQVARATRVLVVDDSAVIRILLDDVLSALGYEVQVAEDGVSALAMMAASRPDVVLTDLNMPQMDGFALLAAMRDLPDLATLPVVVISSEDGEAKQARGKAEGVAGWIVKPFEPAELIEALWRLDL